MRFFGLSLYSDLYLIEEKWWAEYKKHLDDGKAWEQKYIECARLKREIMELQKERDNLNAMLFSGNRVGGIKKEPAMTEDERYYQELLNRQDESEGDII